MFMSLIISSGVFRIFYIQNNFYTQSHLQKLTLFFFLAIWILFILFSCLIALARSSRMKLNSSGEGGHPGFYRKSFKIFTIEYNIG